MELLVSLDWLIILFGVSLVAGFVDSIAGGGGLITVPVLLAAGLQPAQALATNKLQSSAGSLSASSYFVSRKLVNIQSMRSAIVLTFAGSVLGTLLVQQIDARMLGYIIPILMIGIVLYFVFSPSQQHNNDTPPKVSSVLFATTAAPAIGFYDGFFGPGTGSFFLVAFTGLLGFSLTKATAHAKVLNCTSNIASLLFFALGGQVVWIVGGVMMLGQWLGARLGSRVVVSKGQTIIRPMIITVSLAMTVKLIFDQLA